MTPPPTLDLACSYDGVKSEGAQCKIPVFRLCVHQVFTFQGAMDNKRENKNITSGFKLKQFGPLTFSAASI